MSEKTEIQRKWVGRARWHHGSFYLWGDVPAVMPFALNGYKQPGISAISPPIGNPDGVA